MNSLIIAALVPKPVPDEQNFAATPVIKSWFEKRSTPDSRTDNGMTPTARVAERVHPPGRKMRKAERQFEDLVGLGSGLCGAAVRRIGPGSKEFYSAKLDAELRARRRRRRCWKG